MSVCCVLNKCQCLTPFADSSNSYVNTVDIFNATAGTWSTAVLSAARGNLAATSLPNLGVAIFAGGFSTCCRVCFRFSRCMSFCYYFRRIYWWNKYNNVLDTVMCHCLTLFSVGSFSPSQSVDIFNATAGTWSTAVLSAARGNLAATSLPNLGVAIFAGGYSTCCRVCFGFSGCISFVRRNYGWNNVLDTCHCLTLCADGNAYSVNVDIFNATAGTWSTAVLSAARWTLAATSLPNLGVAIFAGGEGA